MVCIDGQYLCHSYAFELWSKSLEHQKCCFRCLSPISNMLLLISQDLYHVVTLHSWLAKVLTMTTGLVVDFLLRNKLLYTLATTVANVPLLFDFI